MDEKRTETSALLPTTTGKEELSAGAHHARATRRRFHLEAACLIGLYLLISISHLYFDLTPWTFHDKFYGKYRLDLSKACIQAEALVPGNSSGKLADLESSIDSTAFRDSSVIKLAGIVQIPSVTYDDLGEVGKDSRFDIFYDIEKYLNKSFPLVHSKLHKENVNTHGLLYTWQGTDERLKPFIFMSHQDVVPVEGSTIDDWTFPPFSGHFDGTHVWGRGSSDCKNQLIATLSAIELLLEHGFTPKRTILLSFGFDEEVSGPRGARTLAARIEEIHGKDSIAGLIDEGGSWTFGWGSLYGSPSVAEKGYTDVHITVRTPGGHSSIPTDHTSIGILSELITMIEQHPYKPSLADDNPYLGALTCGAKYSSSFPKRLKHLLAKRFRHKSAHVSPNLKQCQRHKHDVDSLAEAAAHESRAVRYLFQTSQAVDLISGGAKVNALPEKATAVVNHRINIGETPAVATQKIARLATQVAKKYNLTLYAYPDADFTPGGKSITLETNERVLDVAPRTPLDVYLPGTKHLSPWGLVGATTRSLYSYKGEQVKMAPSLMTGNTDTRYYWNLTTHIFRYNPGFDETELGTGLGNIHTVNEKQSITSHVNSVKWFTRFIRNADDAAF